MRTVVTHTGAKTILKKTRLHEGYLEKYRPSKKKQGAFDINCFAHLLTLGPKTFWSWIWTFAHLLFQKKNKKNLYFH